MWKRRVAVLMIALVSASGVTFASPDEAAADCVEADVRYEVLNGGENTVWNGCVVPTPINNQDGHLGPTFGGDRDLVWVYVDLWIPLP